MILPDWQIIEYGEKLISPFKHSNVQPASVDLTLSGVFIEPKGLYFPIDLLDLNGTIDQERDYLRQTADSYLLKPRTFVLGSTAEMVKVPPNLVGRVEGKSSLGRLGLLVHSTAGFIDPGFEGTITLEFYNLNPRRIWLHAGQKICQVSFTELTQECNHPYGSKDLDSKYQGQSETTTSRYRS